VLPFKTVDIIINQCNILQQRAFNSVLYSFH